MSYPMKFQVGSKFLSELHGCEYGRYEDAMLAREKGDEEEIRECGYEVVACDFLERHKSVIEVRNDAELVELYYALASGTIGLMGHTRKANNLLDKIRDQVIDINPEIVKMFPYQMGA